MTIRFCDVLAEIFQLNEDITFSTCAVIDIDKHQRVLSSGAHEQMVKVKIKNFCVDLIEEDDKEYAFDDSDTLMYDIVIDVPVDHIWLEHCEVMDRHGISREGDDRFTITLIRTQSMEVEIKPRHKVDKTDNHICVPPQYDGVKHRGAIFITDVFD